MDPRNDSCGQNLTDAAIQQGALAIGLPGIACFILNLVGLTAELIFVCTKKNTFLLRLFVYLSIAVTMAVGCYSSFILMYFWPRDQFLCELLHTFLIYSAGIELCVVFSIAILLLYIVSSSFQLRSRKSTFIKSASNSQRRCLEAVFVGLCFGTPAVALSVFLGVEQKAGVCFTIRHSLDCYLEKKYILIGLLTFELIPALLDTFLCLLCVCLLLVWLCWLRSRLLLKTRRIQVIKEVGAWLGFLLVCCFAGNLIEVTNFTDNPLIKLIAFTCYPLLHSCIPILFFVYMYINMCPCCKKPKDHPRAKATRGLQTAPPSTRVSLPSDTVAHAPKFLSPIIGEEVSEESPLIVSFGPDGKIQTT